MVSRVRVVEGPDTEAELASLWDWLRREQGLRGRVELERRAPEDGEMGAAADALVVAVGGGGAITVFASSLSVWLRQRRADVVVEVTGPDGRIVKVGGWRVADPVGLVREVLDGGGDEHATS